MGEGARLPTPCPPHSHHHQSTPIPYLHATAPVAASSTLSVPRPAPIPRVRVSRPRRGAAMSAATAADSSTIGVSDATEVNACSLESVGHNNLLIIGPGVLGRIVAEMWKQEHPGSDVYGHTATTDHHCELTGLGIIPSLKGSIPGPKFPYVIFCAPPYHSEDYAGDLRVAASNWNGEGSFLFTSSTAVYDCSDNGLCNEDSPCVQIGQSPRTDVLLKAENVVLEAGGCVLRLVGLYISSPTCPFLNLHIPTFKHLVFFDILCRNSTELQLAELIQYSLTSKFQHKSDRGPHVYWLSKGTLDARPDHILNLIHYEDAASLAIAIMKKRFTQPHLCGL